jgi:hypothetical protein
MLFRLTDPALKHKGYPGGHVENANGYDIIFQALDDLLHQAFMFDEIFHRISRVPSYRRP